MANFVFNIGKGRGVELYNRVESNDPATSALIVVLLAATGLEADAVLKDADTLAAVLAGTTNEATNVGYARKVLTDVELAPLPAPDDVADTYTVAIPNQTWAAVAAAPDTIGKLLVCYDANTGAGTDADIVPITAHDFVVTPDGTDLIATFTGGGFYRAKEC